MPTGPGTPAPEAARTRRLYQRPSPRVSRAAETGALPPPDLGPAVETSGHFARKCFAADER